MVFETQESISSHSFPSCFRWHWQIIPIAPRSPLSPRTRIPAIRGAKDNRVRSIIWLAISGSKCVLGDFICNKGRIHEEKRQRQPNNFDEEYRTIKVGRIVAAKGIEEMQSRVPLCMGPHRFKKGKLFRICVARLPFKKI